MMNTDNAMDLVVCGIPRSGTTFLGMALNAHPEVYCYFTETALFRQLWMLGAERPLPQEHLEPAGVWLQEQFHIQLVRTPSEENVQKYRRLRSYRELVTAHKIAEPTGPGIRVFDDISARDFAQEVTLLLGKGLYGDSLFEAGAVLLGEILRGVTGRKIIGEKTPDNIFALPWLFRCFPKMRAICMVREPFATIDSMRRRARRSNEVWDQAFSSDFYVSLGSYYRYLRGIGSALRSATAGGFVLVRYEDLGTRPIEVVTHVLQALGVDGKLAIRDLIEKMATPQAPSPLEEVFTPEEIALARMILSPMLEGLGYGSEFYQREDRNVPGYFRPAMDKEQIAPLYGFYIDQDVSLQQGALMEREASVILIVDQNRSRIEFSLTRLVPESVADSAFKVEIYEDGRLVSETRMEQVGAKGTLKVPLDKLHIRRLNQRMLGTHIQFRASDAYRPITVPGLGPDIRELSVKLEEVKII